MRIQLINLLAFIFVLPAFSADYVTGQKIQFSSTANKDLSSSSKALLPDNQSYLGGYNNLLPFIMPSPSQENAGSCLFMSHTGIVEVLLNKRAKTKKYDLSERYFMNLQKSEVGNDKIANWRTDTIERLNVDSKMYSNDQFRYTKGFYKIKGNRRAPAIEGEEGAKYSIKYNWIVELDKLTNKMPISLPTFGREVLFADPDQNQWNVNTAPKNIVQLAKDAIKKNNSPLLVIYNHHGFWHAVMVAGYNDNASSDNCKFVSSYEAKMNERADEIIKESTEETDPKIIAKLKRKALKFRKRGNDVQTEYENNGGCRGKGVFYVRDSIYPNKDMPLYDYDKTKTGEEENYNSTVILREYEWLERLSNHVVQIYAN